MKWQQRLCFSFDRLLPAEFAMSGKRDFLEKILPSRLDEDMVVYDVGGGKNPAIGAAQKAACGLYVVGVDLDAAELSMAPAGSYDRTVTADITRFVGDADGDLVVCSAALEHIQDTGAALAALASILRPGGLLLVFVPSRHALFARLNLLLPEALKRAIMFTIFPKKRRLGGFPAYYDKCTPREMRAILPKYGFKVENLRPYYKSNYFSFLLPLHVTWRLYQLGWWTLNEEQAAETFVIVARKALTAPPEQPAR